MNGLLLHAAILARECGLPAVVVSAEDATRRVHDGERVELDGTTGRARVLERTGCRGLSARSRRAPAP